MQYVLKKDLIEHARLRALATSIINKEKAAEVFDEYRKEAFPWVETQQKRDRDATVKILNEEVKSGVLGIKPLWEANAQSKVRSRLKTKVMESDGKPLVPTASADPAKMRSIYSKLGSVM